MKSVPRSSNRRSPRRPRRWSAGLALFFGGALALLATNPSQAARPNFLIVLADDLGYGDVGCYGNQVMKTPNLDEFAAQGMRLTDCYAAAANCSPARAGLMTGRTPYRCGIHNWISMLSPMHLQADEVTLATLLQRAGYTTCHVGKWHLNGRFNLSGQPQPDDHGFDYWFSTQNNALPSHQNPDNFVRNGEPVGALEGYSAEIVAEKAIAWLSEERDRDKPFFVFVCFHEPHEPIATDPRFSERYSFPDEPSRAAHHGNVTQMDDAFGRILQAVDDLELRDDTFLFFTSDNGPAITRRHPHGSAGPLRHKKGHLYEGGIRVPGILRWPGRTQPGQVCREPISGVDLLPTVCEIVGADPPQDRPLDGASFLPIFEGKPPAREKPLYWQFNYARSAPKIAMRDGDWKILASLTGEAPQPTADIRAEDMTFLKQAEPHAFELYNLRQDIGEATNLADREPERLEELARQLTGFYHEVRGESPVWPAWESPRIEARRIRAARQ